MPYSVSYRAASVVVATLGAVAIAGAGALAAPVAGPSRGGVGAVSAASRGPVVQAMIVGSGGVVLAAARNVPASVASVPVAGRRCAVSAGTPLAVLAAERRAHGPPFKLRDYGHCGASAANSGQLFVYSIAAERNRGQSGWEYKVDGVAGST